MHYIFAYTEYNRAATHALQGYFLVAVIGAITLLQIRLGNITFLLQLYYSVFHQAKEHKEIVKVKIKKFSLTAE